MKIRVLIPALMFSLSLFTANAHAATTIAEHTGSPGTLTTNILSVNLGQSLMTGSAASYNNLEFAFLGPPQLSDGSPNPFPFAATSRRTLYLLESAYAGDPAALSSSTAGFVASATSTSTADISWNFAPSVTVLGGTQYWAYTQNNTSVPGNTLYVSAGFDPNNGYSGGSTY
jgi:hypothetical protein